MSSLERLWAGWRGEYVESAIGEENPSRDPEARCVFCRVLENAKSPGQSEVVWCDETAAVVLNAYPYTSGHLLVLPRRHVADLESLEAPEAAALWDLTMKAVKALKAAYSPEGLNLGANLGRAAGAGLPDHLHLHCLPRWNGDTNFMTSVAGTRVLPETLAVTHAKVTAAWPS